MKKDSYDRFWDVASRRYASQAVGSVKTFAAGAISKSTFRRIETPTLLNNRKITQINGLDRAKLKQFKQQKFQQLRTQGMDRRAAAAQAATATHRRIAIAELKQDSRQAKNAKDRGSGPGRQDPPGHADHAT